MAIYEIKGIKKSFGNTEVLRGIDFSMEKGETVAIIGSSGSGKTTLLRCINFLERPDSGKMYLNDKLLFDAEDKKKLNENEIRSKRLHFGLVFQQFNLFPQYTVFENLCLSPKLLAKERPDYRSDKKNIIKGIEEKAKDLLSKVGLSAKSDSYPCTLSGGQQQRVAIARALVLNPDILCFDEPTSALDPELTNEVLNVLKSLAAEKITMIIVTHEMSFAKDVADRAVFMDSGVVVEQGDPKKMLTNPESERLRAFLNTVTL